MRSPKNTTTREGNAGGGEAENQERTAKILARRLCSEESPRANSSPAAATPQPDPPGLEPRLADGLLAPVAEPTGGPGSGSTSEGVGGSVGDPAGSPDLLSQAERLAAELVSGPAPLLTCPACGWPGALLDQRSLGLGFACQNCYREAATYEDFVAEARRLDAESWRDLPSFKRTVVRDPEAERALRRVAKPVLAAILDLGGDPAVALEIVEGVNGLRSKPMPRGRLEDLLVGVAREVAAARRRGGR
jgi:hypothetical protein